MARLTRTRHATGACTTRYIDKTTSAQKTQRSLRNFLHQEEHARSICTDNSLEFIEACEELNWNHERSAPQRSENTWNCRTSSTRGESMHFVSIGSVWTARAEAKECHCYLRNAQDPTDFACLLLLLSSRLGRSRVGLSCARNSRTVQLILHTNSMRRTLAHDLAKVNF